MSLIEVMVAGMLLAVGAAATLSSWATVSSLLERQRRLTDATGIARSSLERLLAAAPGDPALAPGTRVAGRFDIFGAADPAGYEVRHTVVGNRPGPGFVELTVLVEWKDRFGAKSTRLTTYRER